MEFGMELPGILKQLVSGRGQGFIELCPEEYDMGNLSDLIEEALMECEALNTEDDTVSVASQD